MDWGVKSQKWRDARCDVAEANGMKSSCKTHRRYRVCLLVVALGLLSSTGCVRRTMLIRSYPEGAVVYVDHQEQGTTPLQLPYTYYGAHRILVEKDGYETQEVDERFDPPWYQIPPLDFFFETMWPFEMRDDRIVDFHLTPQQQVRQTDLRDRAESLRANVNDGFVTPLINEVGEGRQATDYR